MSRWVSRTRSRPPGTARSSSPRARSSSWTSFAAAPSTPWVAAARAVATSEFEQAAALYAEIGSLPDEALARLCAARRLMARGRRDEANAELDRALAFHRRVGAKRYVQEGEAVLAAAR